MSSNNIIKYLYVPYLILNIIFYSSSSLIQIKLNIFLRFKTINYFALLSLNLISNINNSKYLFFRIRVFILL